MTKEEKETIERIKKRLTRKADYNTGVWLAEQDIETVLNMLKEKDAEIEKYKKLLADNLAKNLNDSIKAKEKADTDLDDLNKGWQVELEKYKQLYNKITAHDNMKKDKEIQFQKDINKTEKDRHKQAEKSMKGQIEKKDKMIDLTLEFLAERDLGYYQKEEGGEIQGIFRKYNKDDWKQYFERKEENV